MRSFIFRVTSFVFLLILISAGFSSDFGVRAAPVFQDALAFDGMNIYFTEAGKESSRFDRSDAGLSRFAGLLRQLGANLYTLEWRTAFPTDADLIVVAGPEADLTPDQIARLWAYVNNRGRLLLIAEPITGVSKAMPFNSGLFQLMWGDMGIRARGDVVVTRGTAGDAESSAETAQPAAALVANFTVGAGRRNHPIIAGLAEELAFFGARSIEYDAAIQGFDVTPLVMTDSTFYGETAFDAYLNEGRVEYNIGLDTTQGALGLAVAFESPRTGTRIVVIGDRQFATNGGGLRTSPPNSASFVYPGNVQFLLNSVTWLLERPAVEMAFPTPGPTATVTITPTPTIPPTPTATPAS